MKNKMKFIIPALVVVILLVFMPIYFMNKTNLTSINTQEFEQLLEDGKEKVVYIGRPTCPQCEEILPDIDIAVKDSNVKAYYYNTDKAKKKNYDEFEVLKENINLTTVPVIIRYNGAGEVDRYVYENYIDSKESLAKFIENED